MELQATDAGGCTSIYTQEVSIPFQPVPDFDYDQACTGNEGIQFTDLSTVQGADVVAWQWRVNGNVVSSEQEPLMFFDESGTRSFELMVMSTNGCTETIQRNIEILASPEVSFSSDISCESLPSSFTDNTPSQQGVVSRLWTIDGQNYAGPSANHIFDAPGDYEVSLTLTADNFCSNTMTTMVTVPEKPALDFNLSSVCTGEDIILTDASTGGDPIVSRTWKLDGEVLGNGTQALAQGVSAGSHTFELEVTTESGCSFTLEQNQVINPSPIAEFDASATYGVPPFIVNFSNESSGTSETSWLVDGQVVSTSSDFSYTFTTEGTFDVALEVTNTEGCTALEEIEILSALPAMNLRVTDIRLTPGQNGQTVVLDLVNHGNLPIEIFDVTVKAGDDFFITERFSDFVGIGGQTSVQLSSTLQLLNSNLVCVSISSAYDDIQPDDNEACVNFTSRPMLENPYPNPFDEELKVRVQMPQQGAVRLTVVNATGRMMVDQQLEDLDEGLNVLRFNSFNWEKGIYLVTIYFGEESVTRRVLKF